MSFILYYKQGLIEKNRQNISEVKTTASILLNDNGLTKHDWLLVKIKNQIERYGLESSVEEVLSKIVKDNYFAAMHAKGGSKQNMSEKLQEKYLGIRNIIIKKLNPAGKNAIRLMDGELITGNDRGGKATKSMDFEGENGEYIFAKVTSGQGGAQDNQYRDVREFLKEAKEYDRKYGNKKFVALVDGDYYTDEKLNILNGFETPNIRITTSDEF
jgi:hypothetical protein